MVMVMNMVIIRRLVMIMKRRIMMIMTLLSLIMIISYQLLSAKKHRKFLLHTKTYALRFIIHCVFLGLILVMFRATVILGKTSVFHSRKIKLLNIIEG